MKKIFNYIITGSFVMLISASCFADLDLKPIDSDDPASYFRDSTECATALVGCYDGLNRYNENLFTGNLDGQFVIWNITDEMYNNAAGTGPKVYSYNSGYATCRSMYKQLYAAIQRCSQLLHYLPKASMKTEAREMIEGEARFIRAFCYFNLVQNWGRVPLHTEPTASVNNPYMKQSSEAAIYDWVIDEMSDAEKLVKPITYWGHGGRVNKSGVRAVLARVCLFKAGYPCYDQKQYGEAYKWAKMVIDDPAHSLIPNYADVFIPLIQDKYDIRENLWEIESYFASTTDNRTEYMPTLSVTLGTNCSAAKTGISFMVNNTIYVTKRMFNYFEQDQDVEACLGSPDERRNWSISPFTNAPASIDGVERLVLTYHNYKPFAATPSKDKVIYDRQVNKFNRQYAKIWPAFQSNAGTNLCIVRYADVLLMAAEALCMKDGGTPPQEAVDYVNKVRERGYGKLDGRKFIDRIEVTAPGSGYAVDKVCVEVLDESDATGTVTCTTSNTEVAKAYRIGDLKGAPTIASATVGIDADAGKITAVMLRDRGHAYKNTPKVVIRNISGTAAGQGATAVAVMRSADYDHLLPASATASKETFMQAIMDERARELGFEGWRRLDLKRWHKLVEVVQATRDDGRNASGISGPQLEYILTPGNNIQEAHNYLPIPAAEIMLNRELVQNEGW